MTEHNGASLVISGTPQNGFEAWGPFKDVKTASDWAEANIIGSWSVMPLNAPEEIEESEDHDECDEDGTDGGCSRCESMGLCPECGSASPGRCGHNDDEDEDEPEHDNAGTDDSCSDDCPACEAQRQDEEVSE